MTALILSAIFLFCVPVSVCATEPTEEGKEPEQMLVGYVETSDSFIDIAATWYDAFRFYVIPILAGLVYTGAGFSLILPAFLGQGEIDASRSYVAIKRLLIYTTLGFLVAFFLPTILKGAVGIFEVYEWKP